MTCARCGTETLSERIEAARAVLHALYDTPCDCGHSYRQHHFGNGYCVGEYVPGEKKNRPCRCKSFVERAGDGCRHDPAGTQRESEQEK